MAIAKNNSKSGKANTPKDGPLSHKEILIVLSGLMTGMLLAALDQTIVSTALKKDRKSTRLNSSHVSESRMPSSA